MYVYYYSVILRYNIHTHTYMNVCITKSEIQPSRENAAIFKIRRHLHTIPGDDVMKKKIRE